MPLFFHCGIRLVFSAGEGQCPSPLHKGDFDSLRDAYGGCSLARDKRAQPCGRPGSWWLDAVYGRPRESPLRNADIKANAFSITDVFQTRRELSQLSGAYERFSPEGQKRLSQLEARLQDLQTKYENNVKATQDRDTHLEAIRRELSSPDYQPPFSPELYRLALETATPFGYSQERIHRSDIETDYIQEINGGYTDAENGYFDTYSDVNFENVIQIEAKPGTKENPIDVHLKYKKGWTSEQRAVADAKIKAYSEAITVKTKSERENPQKLRSKYKKAHGIKKIPDWLDMDHVIDL